MRIRLPDPVPVPRLVRICYLLNRLVPGRGSERRLGFLLDLEWTIARLAHETSVSLVPTGEHPHHRATIDFLERHLRPDDSVLDVGCGTGVVAAGIAPRVASVTGIDHDASAIEAARQTHRAPNLAFEAGDAVAASLSPQRGFDVAILSHVVEHLDDPAALIGDLAASVNRLYLEVPDFEASILNLHRERLARPLVYSDADHRFEFDRSDVESMLADCGLQIVDREFRLGSQRYWCATHRRLSGRA